jgi:SpoVT / AbrB like domain.
MRTEYKVNYIGGSYYVVIPREIVRKFNLEKGMLAELVEIREENDRVILVYEIDLNSKVD